jgi:membrane protease YdiL (CAAX protease family)
LQRRPEVRSVVYLSGAAALLRVVAGVYAQYPEIGKYALHITVLPFGAAWTYAFIRLRREDLIAWKQVEWQHGVRQVGTGALLGAGAFALFCGAAAACGWARLPAWGWAHATPSAILHTVFATAPEFLAAAFNEELVFRGYGLDTASAAVGRPAAIAGLTALFAWAHGRSFNPPVLAGTAAAGLALVALRMRSGGLWMPVGYHFAWNYVQTAVLGPADQAPSLRPVQFDGPELWLGRPGYPEPGLLATLVNLLVTLLCVRFGRRTAA